MTKRNNLWWHGSGAAVLGFLLAVACGQSETGSYRSAISGQTCEPDMASFQSRKTAGDHGNGGARSPTGIPGDNMDDPHSGKIDCLGDGNSGQGDDKKHECVFPQPGCDENGCCDIDVLEPVDGDDDPLGEIVDPAGPGEGDDDEKEDCEGGDIPGSDDGTSGSTDDTPGTGGGVDSTVG